MGAIISNIVPACGVWLFGPNLVQSSKTLFVLLEYGYLVPNECLFKSSLCLWNVVIWSQMGAIISNIVPACGVWLFGPNLVHIKNIVCAP
jgi:hypothetical protein